MTTTHTHQGATRAADPVCTAAGPNPGARANGDSAGKDMQVFAVIREACRMSLATPANRTIAEAAGLTCADVDNGLRRLKQAGIIHVHYANDGHKGRIFAIAGVGRTLPAIRGKAAYVPWPERITQAEAAKLFGDERYEDDERAKRDMGSPGPRIIMRRAAGFASYASSLAEVAA